MNEEPNFPQDSPEKDNTQNTGRWMLWFFWLSVLGLLSLGFGLFDEKRNNPNQELVLNTSLDSNGNSLREVQLKQNRRGHYLSSGKINGKKVTFLLDTGATHVSVPGKVAKRLSLEKGPAAFTRTANGTVKVFQTRINEIDIGDIKLHNVKASINPQFQGDQILLGMSALRNLELEQKNKVLTIRQVNY